MSWRQLHNIYWTHFKTPENKTALSLNSTSQASTEIDKLADAAPCRANRESERERENYDFNQTSHVIN